METKRVRAEINLDALLHNLEAMHQVLKPEAKMVAVIKTDAYGHGALGVAEAIEHLPYLWGYAVATADEAEKMILDGRKKPMLILGISFADHFEKIINYEIRPTICDFETAQKLSELAVSKNKICKVHIKIDTGMSRIGFQVSEDTARIIETISRLPNMEIEGIFTHFASADEADKTVAMAQMERFGSMISMLESRGIQIPIKHCSNSAGIVELPQANMDMVRAGITMYGLWPSEEVNKEKISLLPVMSIKSHISFVKTLEPGRSISYGGTYVTEKPRRIATIPIGYGDGYARSLSNKGYVLIHGKKAPICGRVCMDQFMVDVTEIFGVKAGDTVTILGKSGNLEITMEELGELSGRFNYEFACLITPRVPRVYYRDGKPI